LIRFEVAAARIELLKRVARVNHAAST
jgi:hypothetical protein